MAWWRCSGFLVVVAVFLLVLSPALARLEYAGSGGSEKSADNPTPLQDSIRNAAASCAGGQPAQGVSCNGSTPVALNLAGVDMGHTPIPGEISQLTGLTQLNLSACSLGGTIPSELGLLTNLKAMDLSSGWWDDAPSMLTIGRRTVGLNKKSLPKGQVHDTAEANDTWAPSKTAQKSSLGNPALPYCGLTGSIPQSFSSLVSLTSLFLNGCYLSGRLPSFFGPLQKLRILQLGCTGPWCEMGFEGSIPDSFSGLKSLEVLGMGGLQDVKGLFPRWLPKLEELRFIDLSGTNVSGKIPESISSLQHLSFLKLNGMPLLNGSIPSEIGSLLELTYLSITSADITGTIPRELSGLASLRCLYLSNLPGLSGGIPEELGLLKNLSRLDLSFDGLTGTIPTTLASLPKLESLNLGDNSLVGSIPAAFSNALSALVELRVANNYLSGPIILPLGNTSEGSQWLEFAFNYFTNISTPPSKTCNISANFFQADYNCFPARLPCISYPSDPGSHINPIPRPTSRPASQCLRFCGTGYGSRPHLPCGGLGTCGPARSPSVASKALAATQPPFACTCSTNGTVPSFWKSPPNQTCESPPLVAISQAPAPPPPAPPPSSVAKLSGAKLGTPVQMTLTAAVAALAACL